MFNVKNKKIFKSKGPAQILPPPLTITHEQFNDADPDVAGIVRVNEDGELLKEYIKTKGLTQYIIDTYDDWLKNRLHKNLRRDVVIEKNNAIVNFSNITIVTPKEYPEFYRKTNSTYAIDIYVDIHLWVTPKAENEIKIEALYQELNNPNISDKKAKSIKSEIEKLKNEVEDEHREQIEELRSRLQDVTDKKIKNFIKQQIEKLEKGVDMFAQLDDERRRRIIEQHDLKELPGEQEPPIKGMKLIRTKEKIYIFSIPLLLGSKYCKLRKYIDNKNESKLKEKGEDPLDPFGYFVINGNEKIVVTQEKLRLNRIFLYRRPEGVIAQITSDTISRGTMITKLIISNEDDEQPGIENSKSKKKNKTFLTDNQYIKIFITSQRPDQIENDVKLNKSDKNITSDIEELITFRDKFGGKSYKGGIKNVYVHFAHVFKILGIEDNNKIKETILLFAPEKNRKALSIQIIPSMHKLYVEDSVDYLSKILDIDTSIDYNLRKSRIKFIIESDIIPHLISQHLESEEDVDLDPLKDFPDISISTKYKIYTLSIMIVKLLEFMAGLRDVDNRDSWGNKMLETAGAATEQLVRSAWSENLKKARKKIMKADNKKITDLFDMFYGSISGDSPLTKESIIKSFRSTLWGITSKSAKNNICQKLEINNLIAKISHIRIVTVNRNRSSSLSTVREVQPSSMPGVCFTQSSEGENCGMIKTLGITSLVSLNRDENLVLTPLRERKLIRNFPKEGADDCIMLNSIFIGWCDSDNLFKILKEMKRKIEIPFDTGIVRTDDGYLHVHTDGGRLIVPMMVVDKSGSITLVEKDMKNLRKNQNINFEYLTSNGYIEYTDSWEQEYIMLATSKTDLFERSRRIENARQAIENIKNGEIDEDDPEKLEIMLSSAEKYLEESEKIRRYTHSLLDPIAILGVSASTIPLANHNQGPRNTYETNMVKQAMAGMYHWNQANRFDGTIKLLLYSNKPLFSTISEEFIGLEERPQGQNVIVAFGSHPYTQEDSFVVSKRFIDLGGFMNTKITQYESEVINTSTKEEILKIPTITTGQNNRYRFLTKDGLPGINAYLNQGDCIIGKVKIDKITKDEADVSEYIPLGEEGRVVDVNVTKNLQGNLLVRVKIIVHRKPQVGDKFSNRNSQKGTVGLIEEPENMPFTPDGMIPDIIINSHSVSRMTGAYFLELITGNYTSLYGNKIDATSFRPVNLQFIQQKLAEIGYNRSGKRAMMSGIEGTMLTDSVYIGPCYFHALKHNVRDKIQASGLRYPVSNTTRQAVSGRSKLGGLRFGEMERDETLAHCAPKFLQERLCKLSGGYQIVICNKCKVTAEHKPANKTFACRFCKGEKNLSKIEVPFAFIYFSNLITANGFVLKFDLEDQKENREEEEEDETEEAEEEFLEDEDEKDYEVVDNNEEDKDVFDEYEIREEVSDYEESEENISEEDNYDEGSDYDNDE